MWEFFDRLAALDPGALAAAGAVVQLPFTAALVVRRTVAVCKAVSRRLAARRAARWAALVAAVRAAAVAEARASYPTTLRP